MNPSPSAKLYSLRFKTDQELNVLIGKTLDRGLAAARTLAYDEARKAYEEAGAWLKLAEHRESSRLEWKKEQLRRMLDEAERVRAACG
jgi:hypothetical protein